ncbi:MAG: hypothetical protein ACRD4T_00140 [Candidatus Acidiferrales bacterium]
MNPRVAIGLGIAAAAAITTAVLLLPEEAAADRVLSRTVSSGRSGVSFFVIERNPNVGGYRITVRGSCVLTDGGPIECEEGDMDVSTAATLGGINLGALEAAWKSRRGL